MTNHIRTLVFLLATGTAAFAQLTVAPVTKSSLATEMSNSASFQTLLANSLYTPPNTANASKLENFTFTSATLGLLHFNLMGVTDPLPLPQTVDNPVSLSLGNSFIVSFVTDVKDDTNNFGANNGGPDTVIFSDYDNSNPASLATSRLVTNAGGSTSYSFYDRNLTQGGQQWFQDNELHFLVYQSTELFFGTNMYLLAVEDRNGTATLDYNDGVFLIQNPSTDRPVPEPSTYGMIGAAGLLGLAIYRRRMKAKSAA